MNVYAIERTDKYSYCDNYKAVVVAEDELHAEKLARKWVYGFKTCPLKITPVNLTEEQIVSVENVGA